MLLIINFVERGGKFNFHRCTTLFILMHINYIDPCISCHVNIAIELFLVNKFHKISLNVMYLPIKIINIKIMRFRLIASYITVKIHHKHWSVYYTANGWQKNMLGGLFENDVKITFFLTCQVVVWFYFPPPCLVRFL